MKSLYDNIKQRVTVSFEENAIIITGGLTQNTVMLALKQSLAFIASEANKSKQSVLVNLSQVILCDSSSLAFLVALLRESKKHSIAIQFKHLPKQMIELAKVSGILNVFPQLSP